MVSYQMLVCQTYHIRARSSEERLYFHMKFVACFPSMYPLRLESSFWKCLLASNLSIGETSQESSARGTCAGVVGMDEICDCVGDDCGDEEDRCECNGRLDVGCVSNRAGLENIS